MLSFLKEIAGKAMEQKRKAQKSCKEKLRRAKKTRGTWGQLISTSQSEKRSEDRQGKEAYEFSGP